MTRENLGNKNPDLIGVWNAVTDYFFVDGVRVDYKDRVGVECDDNEASQSNPNAVMDFARNIGATYQDPKKGELFIILTKTSEPQALTAYEVMDLFG